MTQDQIDAMAEYALKMGYANLKRRTGLTKAAEANRLRAAPDHTFSAKSVPGYVLHIGTNTVRRVS